MLYVLVESIILLGLLMDMGHPDIFVLGPPLMVAARRNVLAIFVPAATSSTMVIRSFGSNVDQSVRLLFPKILVLILLSMLVDYFNGYAVRVVLALRLKIKIIGKSLLVFTGLWFDVYVIFYGRKEQDCVMEQEKG